MRAILSAIVLVLILGVPLPAQSTAVSGTVADTSGQAWQRGTVTFTFRPSPSNPFGPYVQNGAPFNINSTFSVALDNTGSFSGQSIPDNATISPSGSSWTVKVCPAATVGCFSVLSLTITGTSQNITSAVIPTAISVNVFNPGFYAAYNDNEITGARQGSIYTNLTDGTIHYCSTVAPCTWLSLTVVGSSPSFSSITTTSGPNSIGGTTAFTGNNTILPSSTGNIAARPGSSDAVQFVSQNGNDSNDGLSWGSGKRNIPAAYSALPGCTVAKSGGSSTFDHCGTILLGAGTFALSTQLAIDTPHVRIVGNLAGPTILSYSGTTGCYLAWHDANFGGPSFVDFDGGVFDVTFDGTSASAGTCGLETYDIIGFRMDGVEFNNFPGAGSSGWWDNAINDFQERDRARWGCSNVTICWNVTAQPTAQGYPGTTFGYGEFSFWAQTFTGQTAASFNGVAFTESTLHVVINGSNVGTAFSVSNHSQISDDLVAIHYETISANSGFVVDGTSKVELMGTLDATGIGNTISTGGVFSYFHCGVQAGGPTPNCYLDSQNPATSGANQPGPYMQVNGNYWNGSASATDVWQISDFFGPGTNPSSSLLLVHGGSSGPTQVEISGGLKIDAALAGGAGVILRNPGGIADSPTTTLPDSTGTALLTGSGANNPLQTQSTAGCATAASLNATCTTVITWPNTFPDASYKMTGCMGNGVTSGVPSLQVITNKVAASITVQTISLTAVAAQFTSIECGAIHN